MATLVPDIDLPQPDVLWLSFLSQAEQDALFMFCRDQVAWEQKGVVWHDRPVTVPRLLAWFGDVPYAYSGLEHPAKPMPPTLAAIKAKIEAALAEQGLPAKFNSVLLNYYRDGNDSIGMHADDETLLGPRPVIASLSLGAERTFKMVHVATRTKREYVLAGGELLVMKGDTQEAWRHGIAKQPGAGPRINLTFRLSHA